MREFLPKRKVPDPFSELIGKQKKEGKEREEQAGAEAGEPKAGTAVDPAESEPSASSPKGKTPETRGEVTAVPPGSLKRQPSPPKPSPGKPSDEPGTDGTEREETPELRSAKAEAIKNAIIQAAGSWGFDYETKFPILDGKGKVDLVLTLQNRRLACEISATSTAETAPIR